MLALLACNQAPSPFEGGWRVTDGGTSLACDGGVFFQPSGNVIVIIDLGGDLFASIDGAGEEFAVNGDTASRVGQGVLYLTADGGYSDTSGSSSTLTLDSDTLTVKGKTLIEHASGVELDYPYSPTSGSCLFNRTLTATRDPP